ncbi:restriction endonuclease [Rhodococcus rhodnii]|uniref:restriction endonuclease n=1 Tax=Rhodococcus rhodnii TaxID=38312 RepID=UPI000ABA0F9D|nr:restriction endonuclease [Rhodococcus rhodnii]
MRIRTSVEAESSAAEYMRTIGFRDATALEYGTGHGIDVFAQGASAQVKWRDGPATAEDLRGLYSTRGADWRRMLLFFSQSGYTEDARDYARSAHMALFTWTKDGIEPVDDLATTLRDRRDRESAARERPAPAPPEPAALPAWRRAGQAISRAVRPVWSPIAAVVGPHWRVLGAVFFTIVLFVAPFGADHVELRVLATTIAVVGAPTCWFLAIAHRRERRRYRPQRRQVSPGGR